MKHNARSYELLRHWFTIPEYQELRDAMSAISPVVIDRQWNPAYVQAMTAVNEWERAYLESH